MGDIVTKRPFHTAHKILFLEMAFGKSVIILGIFFGCLFFFLAGW